MNRQNSPQLGYTCYLFFNTISSLICLIVFTGLDTSDQGIPSPMSSANQGSQESSTENSLPSQAAPNTQLSHLLSKGLTRGNIAPNPNKVGRRNQQTTAAAGGNSGDVLPGNSSSNNSTAAENQRLGLMPQGFDEGMMPRVPGPGFDSSMFQQQQSMMPLSSMAMPAVGHSGTDPNILYQQAGYRPPFPNPFMTDNVNGFGGQPFPGVNGQTSQQGNEQTSSGGEPANLPNLNHIMRMRTPLVLPPIDGPEPVSQDGSDSHSLPSLNNSPQKPMFSLGAETSGNG